MNRNIDFSKTYLGIEFGSTRIKAILIDDKYKAIASGSHDWENHFENGYWTYSLDDIHNGLKKCYESLREDISEKYNTYPASFGAIGISAMMHGYMAFDEEGRLLTPFRTWRNTTTKQASDELTELFGFNIPQRWSIAHLYQAMLNDDEHVKEISYITTLAGYIHYLLTGRLEVGIGEASGMFPVRNGAYDTEMLDKFNNIAKESGYKWRLEEILPEIRTAGQKGAFLTEDSAELLDSSGKLCGMIPICPPEGDAGTGMTATNSVRCNTGNVSAGTSVFAMLVLENNLKNVHREIDIVTTPQGDPVAMVHCNNCCGELDSWVNMFGEFAQLSGLDIDKSDLYESLYKQSLKGDDDCGGITAYNYISGEHIVGIENGKPMYFRTKNSKFNLSNFIRAQLYSSIASLKYGMDILFDSENVKASKFIAHGGLFKVKGVAQQFLANALNTPVCVTENSGEGGAYGMALLAAYMQKGNELSLADWLESDVFSDAKSIVAKPQIDGTKGFCEYMRRHKAGIEAEKMLEVIE